MLGLKEDGKKIFEFDREKDIKADPAKGRAILKTAEQETQKIKDILRKGTESHHFDDFGVLLHGFSALQRVVNRIVNRK